MQRLEVNGAVRLIYGSLGVKRLKLSAYCMCQIQDVPRGTESGISLIILPPMRTLQRNLKSVCTMSAVMVSMAVLIRTFKSEIFNGVRIIIEMLGSVSSGTPCTFDVINLVLRP